MSALVLLVGCLNVANLLIARGLERRREIAVRLALGARRGRIARQMIAESVLLLLAGCALALFLTYAGDHLLLKALTDFYTGLSIDVSLNFRILLFTMSLALLSLVLSGILPAWQASDLETGSALKSAGKSVKGGRAGTRKVLISGQVALTMVLVMGASLLTQTVRDLRSASLGFSPETTLDAQLMPMPRGELPGPAAFAYFTALLDQVRSEVGVTDASLTSFSPLFTLPYKEDIRRLDLPDRSILQAPAEFVSDGFMRTMRIQILQGEDFRRDSHAESQKTAIISKTLTKRLFGDGPALGRHIRFGSGAETQDLKIIGIAADARLQDPRGKELSFLYLNVWQLPNRGNWGNLQIRYSGSSGPIVASLRQELRRNGHQYAYQTRSLETQHELSLLQERVLAVLGATFGVVGLALAAIGIYGLLSFFVGTRQAEFGLRMR